MTKYRVVGRDGKVYTRKSDRVYTHAIVRYWAAYTYGSADNPQTAPAGSVAFSWCGRPDLVNARVKEAWNRSHTIHVEVIPVG